jgi:GNAT superfamily N-acetyltransferase
MPIAIEIADPATDADHEAVQQRLIAFNARHVPSDYEPFALRLRDEATSEVVGGLFARKYYDWLFVELLFVPEQGRRQGLGTQMLAEAEAFARSKGCVGVWLDTFSFQAPDFYAKLGYERFGVIEDYPKGSKRMFYQKRLGQGGAP